MPENTTRKSISTQLREYCQTHGLSYKVGQRSGALVYVIGDRWYTPGQAADELLGGFDVAFGAEVDR